MFRYLLKRIVFSIVTLLIASTLLFCLLQLVPGKPYNVQKVDPITRAQLDDKFGLDEPFALRYVQFIGGVSGFDIEIDDGKVQNLKFEGKPVFGRQWKQNEQDVWEKISGQLPISINIGMYGLVFGLIVGLAFGSIAALRRGTIVDNSLTTLAVLGVSVPSFVFASLLQYYVGGKWMLLPLTYDFAEGFKSLIMPAFALSLFVISSLTRYMRTELVDVLGSDYILLARAKGLTKFQVIFKHAIRNSLIPVVTVIAPLAMSVLLGSVVVEKIFAVPGLGGTLVQAINNLDNPLILGTSFFYSFLYIVIILLVDLSYGIIDPRVRVQGGAK